MPAPCAPPHPPSKMCAASSPSPPLPLATLNPVRGVWEIPQVSLLCGHSVPYSAPWPTSGTTHGGSCFAPPTSGPRIAASGPSSPPGPPSTLLKTPTSNLAKNGGSQHRQEEERRSRAEPGRRGRVAPAADPAGVGRDQGLAQSTSWKWGLDPAERGCSTAGQRHGRSGPPPRWRPPPTVVLPLWADSAPGAEQTDGEHTQPPSPDGRPSPVPRPSPPTRAAGSVPTSSSGCRASMTAGSPPPPGSDDRRSSPRSATALFPNMRHEHCSCGHRPSRGARAARPCSAPLSDFYGRAKPRNLRIL